MSYHTCYIWSLPETLDCFSFFPFFTILSAIIIQICLVMGWLFIWFPWCFFFFFNPPDEEVVRQVVVVVVTMVPGVENSNPPPSHPPRTPYKFRVEESIAVYFIIIITTNTGSERVKRLHSEARVEKERKRQRKGWEGESQPPTPPHPHHQSFFSFFSFFLSCFTKEGGQGT